MKHLYLYIILYCVLPIKMMAQDSDEWPDEKIYVGCSYVRSSLGTKKGMLYYSIKTVEEVDGIKYFKMYTNFDELSEIKGRTHEMSLLDETTCSDVLSLWQDGGKVYCQNEDGTQMWLIFDYGLEAGDTFTDSAGESYIVKESMMTDASKRKKLILVSKDGSKENTWIEGIGSVQYGFLPAYVVRTLKDFQHVEEPLSVNLWMASEPANGADGSVSICQGINDEYLKLVPFQEITDEDMTYDDLPNPLLTCSFVGDSLWVQGYYPLNLYQSFIAASIAGNQIDISFHQVVALDVVKGYRPAKIDVRIPGFKPGVYHVGMPGQERVERECERSTNYFPEGTKWTEIRLDTLKYDSWYSKVGDEWVPNFETIEYYVKGVYTDEYGHTYKCVYTNGPDWTESNPLLFWENGYNIGVTVIGDLPEWVPWPAEVYQFDWSVGKGLYYRDILESNSTGMYPYYFFYGVIDEIKEGDFGGVRPLKYVDLDGKAPYDPHEPGNTDTRGGRIIQGIGITEWNDGECLFGPPNPYLALTWSYGDRHYRSMLVHFERNGEVLYDVWPKKDNTTEIVSPLLPSDEEIVNGKSSNGKWFDLQGRRLSGKPAHGIYIEDGKKKVK